MADAPLLNRVRQRLHDVALADDVGEVERTVLAVERGHTVSLPATRGRDRPRGLVVAVHPPSLVAGLFGSPASRSDQACPRRTSEISECCFLPDLTRFENADRAEPDPQRFW